MFEYFLGGFGAFYSALSYRLGDRESKSKAISSLRQAIRQTNQHIENSRTGQFGDVDFSDSDSKELANLWSKAAESIRPFSSDWANIFESKSDYWTNPEGFRRDIQNGKKRFSFRFRLSEVEKKLIELENRF